MNQPTGTVTFLFTDIDGSTKLWDDFPDAMREAVARHDAVLRQAVADNKGVIFKTTGDGIAAAFALAPDALTAALHAQIALHTEAWPESTVIRSRMGLHTGAAEQRDGDYFGATLNRTARLMAAGHGGQTLLSDVTFELTRDHLPPDVSLLLMGDFRLKDLARPETIYQVMHPALVAGFPSLRTLELLPNNLPQQVTSFIGREAAFADVIALLGKTRLLTLTGSGGTGKTRLALQAAADVFERYPDGVWLAELAPLVDPGFVPQTVGAVLGIKEHPGQSMTQILVEALKDKNLLLVLDNCEHLVSACAQIVAAVIRGCPNVTVLATSREALGIGGEQVYRVPSLSMPDPKRSAEATGESLSQFEAVRLFIDRALLAKSDFAVTNESAPALAQLCFRLDGIPLAIELAAARVRSLTVEQINDRLDSRFRLLTGGDRSALPRQQTLRALIDWGYDLLGDSEKVLLARLSVFAGGWTIEEAESVCVGDTAGAMVEDWEVLDLLTSLSDKSLINPEEVPGELSTRYRMLETIRQYAAERLTENGDKAQVGGRHAAFFLALAEMAEPKLNGPEKLFWLNRLETEHDNLRAALDYCATKKEAVPASAAVALGTLSGLRLAGAMLPFWEARGYLTEGRAHLAEALAGRGAAEQAAGMGIADESAAKKAVAGALVAAGRGAWRQGDYSVGRSLMDESLALYREIDDRKGLAWTLNNLGNVAKALADYPEARSRYEESLDLARESGEIQAISIAVCNLGNLAFYQGDLALARSLSKESLAIERTIGDKSGIAYALINLGAAAHNQGDFPASRAYYEECLPLVREIGDKSAVAITLLNLGNNDFTARDYALASARYKEGLALFRQIGDKSGAGVVLMSLGNVAQYQGDYMAARTSFEESLSLAREIGDRHGVASTLNSLGLVAKAEGAHISALAFYEEALGLRREIGDKRGLAITLGGMGELAYQESDYAVARQRFTESLRFYHEIGDKNGTAGSLQSMAAVGARDGSDALRVATLLGASRTLRESMGAPILPEFLAAFEEISAEARAYFDDEAAWAEAWAEGAALSWDDAVKLALRE